MMGTTRTLTALIAQLFRSSFSTRPIALTVLDAPAATAFDRTRWLGHTA